MRVVGKLTAMHYGQTVRPYIPEYVRERGLDCLTISRSELWTTSAEGFMSSAAENVHAKEINCGAG